ncbi:MAG TPA: hypothetical protein PLO37_08815 [Candidatus Hydrogenedentes bacterium]|nr:hypothetical protein [Candidatus Hydrogenedentota bacterium]HPG66935.1 hypothetical protein [Candidatus Hydrogenedentota bacterium]
MKHAKWQILLGLALLALSAAIYFLHYLIFRDAHHIFLYLVGDIAFVFVEVLLVTLIIHGVLEAREKRGRLTKLNMVIGVFFSKMGTELLEALAGWDPKVEELHADMTARNGAQGPALSRMRRCLEKHAYGIAATNVDWEGLRARLVGNQDFLVSLLENPILLEHETFTNLLWAVFHLAEELDARKTFGDMPDSDRRHLVGDMNRVYGQLALQWMAYMEHLSANYPYLFSLALRMNPFDPGRSPVVSSS